jgi:hypothetical protein
MNKVKELSLTNSKEVTLVDDEDFEYLNQWNWQLSICDGHICRKEHGKPTILLHRVVNKTPDDMLTDHINRNKLDNRKENLRTCTKSQNSMNRTKQKGNCSSKYKGVCWCKTKKKWKARVKYKGKYYSLGYHEKEVDAALAYNKKAKELFSEFFVPNIIEAEVAK